MLTKISINKFKRFKSEIKVELGQFVVFIGPNDSGKTTALQALALWNIGIRQWNAKRKGKESPEKRPGVTINRKDMFAIPVPSSNLLWYDLHVREITKVNGKPETKNICVEIIVEGITDSKEWRCGLEFDYANEESFYCRPLKLSDGTKMPVPDEASKIQIAFLPPMSGLSSNETKLDQGAVNVRIGEGRTAEVLRNLCFNSVSEQSHNWGKIITHISKLFGVELNNPTYIAERGEIVMSYKNKSGINLDLSSSGRGLQQTLLLLSYLYTNPNSVVLLDEPDAHLEILRQRQIYQVLNEVAQEQKCQIVAASHSEVILNEAAGRDTVIAFVGNPHRIDDRGSQLLKSLKEIGFDQYYQAELTGYILYLEGSTDLEIIRAFATVLDHPVKSYLERPFVHYIANQPSKARDHFYGLKEAKTDIRGVMITDHLDAALSTSGQLVEMMWKKREIENYICYPEVLLKYAAPPPEANETGDLFAQAENNKRKDIMNECIKDFVPPVALKDRKDRWWNEVKATDDFLDRLFEEYFRKLGLPNVMTKSNYHILARFLPKDLIDIEVKEKLAAILNVAKR